MGTIDTIKDPRIRVKISTKLLDIINEHHTHLTEVPKNIAVILKPLGIRVNEADTTTTTATNKYSGVDIKLLNDILSNSGDKVTSENETAAEKTKKSKEEKSSDSKLKEMYLYLSDLRWLSQALGKLRSKGIVDAYLHELLETCALELPKNSIIERNPELEARCQKLRQEQQNLEYRKMTKDVDATLKHYPEDTIAYQVKAINSQLVAVLQFIFSVAAGFAFGFLGIQLIVGNLDFGLRLLLGIMIALIIALAEIYFLAKKLNEYDNTTETVNKAIHKMKASTTPEAAKEILEKKLHAE
ncbi:transmembrane protein 199 [Musca vetustissima]|uniref:transmembrane protein 199 n=1 Tax=Musca vetustissima TaxID=27455 RepID=UPI002AB61C2D|nr:transmembrane protein 199 [Musca vetustissima]